jgi:spore maturation protein CgeB
MREWGFVSNRLFDVVACGTPVVSDSVSGVEELFHGAVGQYQSAGDLLRLVELILDDPAAARRRVEPGREQVVAAHTFDHRASELLSLLG